MTKFKVFSIPATGSEAAEQEANAFIARNKIINVDRQFVPNGEHSFWSLCVHFQPLGAGSLVGSQNSEKRGRIDYKEVLSESEFSQFSELRELRKTLAEKDGVPVFGVFNNEQLAQMIQKGVQNATQLKAISGIGDNKLQRYGQPFLAKLRQFAEVAHA